MTRLSGRVPETGTAIEGATVAVVDTQGVEDPAQWSVVAWDTTDANGEWSVSGLEAATTERYHAIAQYDGGAEFVNFESLPYLSTPADVFAPETGLTVGTPTPTMSVGSAIPDSAIARLTFDDADTSGSTAVDIWGSFDGTINGATTGATGHINEAYDFDGTNDFVDWDSLGNITPPISVSLWMNADSLGTTRFFDHDGTRIALMHEQQTTSGLEFAIVDSGGYKLLTSGTSPTGQWVHLVGATDGSTMEFYVDATSQGTVSHGTVTESEDATRVGSGTADSDYHDGKIDDPRIYDKRLSDTEVSNLYNTGSING